MVGFENDKSWKVRRSINTLNTTSLQPDAVSGQKNSSRHQQGFTLLEVVIALMIIATVLVSLLGLQTRTINMSDRQQKVTRATMLAQERMTDIELAGAGSARDDEGSFAEPFEQFRWQVEYRPTPLASVREVTVTVAWGDEGSNEDVALTSFLFR